MYILHMFVVLYMCILMCAQVYQHYNMPICCKWCMMCDIHFVVGTGRGRVEHSELAEYQKWE